jgi:hypothetical protein
VLALESFSPSLLRMVQRRIHRLNQYSIPAIMPPTPAAMNPKTVNANGLAADLKSTASNASQHKGASSKQHNSQPKPRL